MEAVTIGGLIVLAVSVYIDRGEYLYSIREDCRDIAEGIREIFNQEEEGL
jgi:hypothetical protein